jgi:signal transduction histidine kinase
VIVENLPTVEGDPTQMRQLFQNMIGNALKFHRPGVPPVVRVCDKITPDNHQVVIEVQDNGIGFEEQYLDRMFQPFQRLNGAGQYEGSGIGLAICRKIVERHGGAITARSKLNEGSTFIITLPARQTIRRDGL